MDNLAAETAASLTTIHPDYAVLAARIVVSNLHKQTDKDFSKVINELYMSSTPKSKDTIISERVHSIVMKYHKELDEAIDYRRDFDYTYFGFKTLERTYLLRINNKVVERPQHLIMRTAVGIHGDNIPKVIETYTLMAKRFFTHASPTLFNAGTTRPQMSSCFLVGMKDDSMNGIYDTLKTCALISKYAGGIGLHAHNIRSAGTHIAGTNGTSSGVIPMLKVFNATARYADQGGNKRPGAFAIYLEPWHGDIFDFLNIRKNHGNEEMRARDLFSALWIPDLFMEKVENNKEWCLFSPSDVPGLVDAYGEDFEKLYNKYEEEELYVKKVRAQVLWYAILDAQIETGGPFMLYKDACNKKSNQKNIGTIRSSNLCTEIVQYSSPEEVAVCNLASLALPNFIDQNEDMIWYDFDALHKVTKVVIKNLDAIIDCNWYPIPEAEKSNKRHRPVAVGVQGFADMLLAMRLPFESREAKKLNVQIFETIYHAAIEASMELAKDHGVYETYKGSPISEGLLQFDLWDHKPTELWDWDELKNKVTVHGVRNSLVTALMPTASTSQILGFNECFEPYTSNIYSRRVLAGEFQIVNPWLLKDLAQLGLWNDEMKDRILVNMGSIQNIDLIPEELRTLYKTVWEIPQRTVIDMSADRAPFIDQSQSLNIHIKEPTHSRLTSMHFYGWKKGLKTGMYYLRTQAAAAPIQFTVNQERLNAGPKSPVLMSAATAATKQASMGKHSKLVYKEYIENEDKVDRSRLIKQNPTTGILEVLRKEKLLHSTYDSDLSPSPRLPYPSTSGTRKLGVHTGDKGKRRRREHGADEVAVDNETKEKAVAESSDSGEGTRKRRSLGRPSIVGDDTRESSYCLGDQSESQCDMCSG